jgi:hypothetical protein
MTDGQVQSLESALVQAEADADVAIKAALNVASALKRYRSAARQGKLRDLRAAVDSARKSVQTLDQEVANVAESWDFDEETYLQGSGFTDELIEHGRRAGLQIYLQDNRLYCYPALLRVLSGERAVLVDRLRERRLRPSILVGLLRELQKRPPRFRPAEFLQSLYQAYTIATKQRPGRLVGAAVIPLREVHELLTLLPGTAREYSIQEFARDIYLLDQSGETTTKDGARIEFHASTGTKLRRGALSVVTQSGQQRQYYALSFTAPGDTTAVDIATAAVPAVGS